MFSSGNCVVLCYGYRIYSFFIDFIFLDFRVRIYNVGSLLLNIFFMTAELLILHIVSFAAFFFFSSPFSTLPGRRASSGNCTAVQFFGGASDLCPLSREGRGISM